MNSSYTASNTISRRPGSAPLTRVRECGEHRSIGGLGEIRVVADDERVLAAELEADLREPLTCDPRDQAADRGRAGERHDRHAVILDERLSRLVAEAVHDVEQPVGQPRLLRTTREGDGGLRRVLGRLQHRAVAADQRREDLPRDVRDRRVRGDDQPRYAERLAHRLRVAVRGRARHRLAVEASALAGHEVAELDRAVGLAARVVQRLAGLVGDERCDLLAVALEQLRDATQDRAALRERAQRPRRLRSLRCANRGVDVLLARARDGGDRLAGRGRELGECLAARRGHFLARDHVRHEPHAVKPPSTRSSCPVR